MYFSLSACAVVCCYLYSMCVETRVCAVLVAQTGSYRKRWWVSLGMYVSSYSSGHEVK